MKAVSSLGLRLGLCSRAKRGGCDIGILDWAKSRKEVKNITENLYCLLL